MISSPRFSPVRSVVTLGPKVRVGGKSPFLMIADPCAVEGREQVMRTAKFLKKSGIPVLRGGAHKPRTSPHSFQGLREEGLKLLEEVRRETGLLVVTEVIPALWKSGWDPRNIFSSAGTRTSCSASAAYPANSALILDPSLKRSFRA